MQTIKVNDAERRVKARFDGVNEARRKAALKDTLFSEVLHTIFHSTIEVSMGLILLLAAQVMTGGGFTVGDFALFVAYLEPVTLGITAFGNLGGDAYISQRHQFVGDTIKKAPVFPRLALIISCQQQLFPAQSSSRWGVAKAEPLPQTAAPVMSSS